MTAATLASERRILPAPSAGPSSTAGLAGHLGAYGELSVPTGDDPGWSTDITRAVVRSGLVGRGGAGFPTGLKWEPVRRADRRPVVVVNAMEGEPASAKDRVLLERAPHLVLDGAEVVAAVTRAPRVTVCVADHHHAAAESVARAIDERQRSGRSGHAVLLRRPPGRYATGEESALVAWLEGRPARPVFRVDKSVPLRSAHRPVLVHNAETLAHLALIARYGPEWFRRMGTPEAPGSTLVTVSGAVRDPGVLEVELGTPVVDIVRQAGVDVELAAVLVGGYGGTWLAASHLSTPYAPLPLAAVGAACGAGVLLALPATSCGIRETARLARYLAGEGTGQCGPCVFGLPALADDLEQLGSGRADAGAVARIEQRAAQIDGRGACRHPDGAVRMVRSALETFAGDLHRHAAGRPCSGSVTTTVLTLPSGPEATRGVR